MKWYKKDNGRGVPGTSCATPRKVSEVREKFLYRQRNAGLIKRGAESKGLSVIRPWSWSNLRKAVKTERKSVQSASRSEKYISTQALPPPDFAGIQRQGVKIARSPISASQTADAILVVYITSTNPCERLSLCAVLFAPA